MVQRLTYRRRHCYATRSNKVTQVKTPGGRLTVHYNRKGANAPKCGDCGAKINGVPSVRALEMKTFKSRSRSVARAYGGSRCGHCVRQRYNYFLPVRIVLVFLPFTFRQDCSCFPHRRAEDRQDCPQAAFGNLERNFFVSSRC